MQIGGAFHQHHRSLSVTEIGRELVELAIGILGAAEDTERLVQNARGERQGLLRLTCGVEFGGLAVSRWVEDYLTAFPNLPARATSPARARRPRRRRCAGAAS